MGCSPSVSVVSGDERSDALQNAGEDDADDLNGAVCSCFLPACFLPTLKSRQLAGSLGCC